MKKLLIITMAAVSVGLCAKAADDYDGTKTSFEDYVAGSILTVENDATWSSSATDPLFVISNITDFANSTKPSRPDYWAKSSDEKALTIDTDAPLFCKVNDRNTPYTFSESNGPIFFDSVVQFTATDVAAEPDSADKLRVWLYTSPDDVETTAGLFGETSRKTCLVVTAGKYEGALSTSNLKAEHYEVQIDGVELQSDTWHRLTIKAIADIDPTEYATPGFEIWVDGKPVTYGADKKTQFPSLKEAEPSGNETLQCVAFDGKGAVDDIVFTTTAPAFAKEQEAEKYAFTLNFSENVEIYSLEIGGEKQTSVSSGSSYDVEVGKLIYLNVLPKDGYTLTFEGGTFGSDGFGGYEYSFIPSAAGSGTITITAVSTGGGSGEDPEEPEEPAKPTIGGGAVDTAEEFIAAANSGATIKVPTDWTLDGNTLKYADGATYATFADYYKVTLATDGTVTLELDDKAKPEIDETSADKGDAIVVTDAAVALGVTKAKKGLWYGAQAYSDAACTTKIGDEPTGWVQADGETVTVTATKPEADKAFFKVVVTDIAPKSTEE